MWRSIRWLVLVVLLVSSGQVGLRAQESLAHARPETVGLSAERLQRIGQRAEALVAEERLAGLVVLVARQGKIAYFEPFGWQDRENKVPMQRDTLFRIASMTKPITSVAVMILYEEGHFRLEDPVARFIPEFKEMRVVKPPVTDIDAPNKDATDTGTSASGASTTKSDEGDTVPASRPITIRDLLAHTSGLSYHWDPRVAAAYNQAEIANGLTEDKNTLAEDVKTLARLPLAQQPGEGFNYGLNTDVLGYLVEVVSGKPLPEFLRERLFEPLGMRDTTFFLDPKGSGRLAKVYAMGDDGKIFLETRTDLKAGTLPYSTTFPIQGPQKFYSGGGGLCSTAGDYFRFAQMLLNGGKLGERRILSRKTVELMTSRHTSFSKERDDPRDSSFGLGFSVAGDPGRVPEVGSAGTFGWGGFFFTNFFVDPEEELVGITMAQLAPAGNLDWQQRFTILAQQAVDD